MKRILIFAIGILILTAVIFTVTKIYAVRAFLKSGYLPKIICNTGGAFTFHGYAFVGDEEDILMACTCTGKIDKVSGPGLDNDRQYCLGNITYTCYRLDASITNLRLYDKDVMNQIKPHSQEIPCPPNTWTK